jgi:hypothetical protein
LAVLGLIDGLRMIDAMILRVPLGACPVHLPSAKTPDVSSQIKAPGTMLLIGTKKARAFPRFFVLTTTATRD